jgi:RNA polymerase sigma factor (TIGR02999 family)
LLPVNGDDTDEMEPGEVTRFLQGRTPDEPEALALVHLELRRAAARLLQKERVGHTLSPTDLVHEAWLRLADSAPDRIAGRKHFIGLAVRLMQRILIDHARRRLAAKRGGGEVPVTLEELGVAPALPPEELLALTDALERLEALNPRLRTVVEYSFFGGLEEQEIADLLNVTTRTVQRDWVRARAWLHQAMHPGEHQATDG